jgi:5-(carboxyamino)imidazole ribonucleotide synthase
MNSRTSPPPRWTCWKKLRPIRPNRRALAVSQDRIAEKDLPDLGLGLTTAPYAP